MATLNRQTPSLDTFFCEPWSSFVRATKLRFVDNSSLDNRDQALYCLGEGKLSKQEMLVYSQFPALEDFCLVVCHVCNQVVTPQGILTHYEKRHMSPVPSQKPLVPMKPKVPVVAPVLAPSPGDTRAFRVPKEFPLSRFGKAPIAVYPPKGTRNKTCVSLPVVSLEKMPCLSRANSASLVHLTSSSSSSSLKHLSLTPPASQRSGEKLMNGRGTGSAPSTPHSATPPPRSSVDRRPSPARSPLDRRPSSTPSPSTLDRKPSPSPSPSKRTAALMPPAPSPSDKKQQNGTKTPPRSQKRLSGRVFDPNKHCGVQDPETKRSCTRSLTCKTHSLSNRRAVLGRNNHFDVLLAEHKGRAKTTATAKETEKDKDATQGRKEGSSSKSVTSQETPSPSRPHCPNGRHLSTLKLRLANAHIPRVLGSTTSSPLPPPPPAPNPESAAHSWVTAGGDGGGRLSSDEGDVETPDNSADRPAFHYSNHHPQPLGFCVFSSRLMGRGHYVFDRRWDRMRLALQNTVEKHLNSQMWRKVPMAAESHLSSSSSASSPFPSQRTPSPSSLTPPLLPSPSPSHSLSYAATFPHSLSSAVGTLSIGDAAQPFAPVSALGRARNGAHRASRPSAKDSSDSAVGFKRRKNSSSSSSSFSSTSLLTVDNNHKGNGSSYHSATLQGSLGTAAATARRKGAGRGGSSNRQDWLSRADGTPQLSHNSQNSRELSTSSSIPYSPASAPAPPSYGGGAEGRKRRSPGSIKGKASKLSRPARLESLFGNGSDSGGILASGPESPRQAK